MLLLGFQSHSLSQVLLFFLLFLDHLKLFIVVASFSDLSLLIVFVVDLSVVLVLAASTSILALHSALLKIALLLRHKTSMLPIESILEFQEASVILRSKVHSHELALHIGVHIIALVAILVFLGELNVTHLVVLISQRW